jgi:hypothetical protein
MSEDPLKCPGLSQFGMVSGSQAISPDHPRSGGIYHHGNVPE